MNILSGHTGPPARIEKTYVLQMPWDEACFQHLRASSLRNVGTGALNSA